MKKISVILVFITFVMFIYSVRAEDQIQGYVDNYATDVSVEVHNHATSIFNSITRSELIIILAPFIVAPILITIALLSISKQVNRLTKNVNKTIYGFNNTILDSYNEIEQNEVNNIIDGFDISSFNALAYKIFCNVKNCIMNFNYDELRNFVDYDLYNIYSMELDSLKKKDQKEIFRNFELLCIKLFDLKEFENNYIAKVALSVKFYNYIENVTTQNILMGSKTHKSTNNCLLTFSIPKDKLDTKEWKLTKEEKII